MNNQLILVLLALISLANCSIYNDGGLSWTDTCSTGANQSPINIEDVQGVCDNSVFLELNIFNATKSVTLQRKNDSLEILENLSNLYATNIEGNLFGYTGYKLQIHSPAEHTIGAVTYDVEVQLYYNIQNEFLTLTEDRIAVISLLFKADDTQNATFFTNLDPLLLNTIVPFNLNNTLNSTFDSNSIFYMYHGSLTQPNCSETVNWYVYPTVLYLSTAQQKVIDTYFKGELNFAQGEGNNRLIQPQNGRVVKKGNTVCEDQFIYFFSFFILYIFINYFIFKLL